MSSILRQRLAWLAFLVAATACSNDFDGLAVAGTDGAAGSGAGATATGTGTGASSGSGASSTSSASASGASGATGGAGGEGAAGGASSSSSSGAGGATENCGNGVIDDGEECDGGPNGAVGCASCMVDCAGQGEVHDPTSHHCYYRDPDDGGLMWDAARTFCQTTWGGGDLLVLETIEEYQFLAPDMAMGASVFFFVGASDSAQEGVWVWLDGSPVSWPFFNYPWMTLPAQPDGNGDCMIWRADTNPDAEGLGDLNCQALYHPFCERPPPGG